MAKTTTAGRSQRNNPYQLDELFLKFHRTPAGIAWRWRTELLTMSGLAVISWRLDTWTNALWAGIILGGLAAVAFAVPHSRRFITRRFWCVLARHRLQRLCYEARLHTRSGRLPLILWTRPTKVGERTWVLCRAGICAEDFEAHIGELRAACYARDARVTRNRRWSQLITIDVIRRDTLAASELIASPLQRLTAHYPQLALVPDDDNLAERNMLLGGEPGAGKSSGLNLIVAHGALSYDCKLILVDGKQVELGMWRACADEFIGPSITDAIAAFEHFQHIMNDRYRNLLATGRRKIAPDSGEDIYLIPIDEYAYFSATVGTKPQRENFAGLSRDLVARGRAAGVIVVLATQRPSHQVIDPSMRDLFSYRWAFRCTTDSSSDVVLGQGWASEGYTAADIDPLARGVGWLLSESGVPRRIKAAYLDDDTIKYLAAYAARLRRGAAA